MALTKVDISMLEDAGASGQVLTSDGTNWTSAAVAGGGKVVQVVNVMDTAVDSGTTLMFSDDTIPTITEGDEFMTLAITPTNASNKLIIQVVAVLSHSSTGGDLLTALYQDATSAALAAVDNRTSAGANNTQQPTNFLHYMTAGTTSSTTFRVRCGSITSGTLTFNGQGTGRKLGGVCASSITIWEIEV